jgi:hypothetical protein
VYADLLDLVLALARIPQSPRYHPEGDALYHSLQVFEHARRESRDPALHAAALLHDVGKALRSGDHDAEGADLLEGLVAPRVVWLVRHHLDLLRDPGATSRRLHDTVRLRDLELLRRWDLAGRSPRAIVCSPEVARRLGVSQQVVQKSLYGVVRRGRPIGGSLRRLREALSSLVRP